MEVNLNVSFSMSAHAIQYQRALGIKAISKER